MIQPCRVSLDMSLLYDCWVQSQLYSRRKAAFFWFVDRRSKNSVTLSLTSRFPINNVVFNTVGNFISFKSSQTLFTHSITISIVIRNLCPSLWRTFYPPILSWIILAMFLKSGKERHYSRTPLIMFHWQTERISRTKHTCFTHSYIKESGGMWNIIENKFSSEVIRVASWNEKICKTLEKKIRFGDVLLFQKRWEDSSDIK